MQLKNVLIITYYWPPAGGPGVQRWLKFSKYLPEFGWNPIIFTPENPSYPILDTSLCSEVSENIEVIKTKIWEPYQWAEKLTSKNKKFKVGQFDLRKKESWKSKLSIFIRGNFFIPDARLFWVKPSVDFLRKYLKKHRIDTLVTTGPPHSLHLIGLKIKEYFPHVRWVADFRDPWTDISYYKYLRLMSFADRKHRILEKKVFQKADITLATGFTDAEKFRKKGAKSFCITNGYDEDDFSESNKENSVNNKFTIGYIGIMEQIRNPKILWEILHQLLSSDKQFAKDFELKFVGKIDAHILSEINNTALKNRTVNLGYLSHKEAIEEMKKASMLLLTSFSEELYQGIIPGKIFEYMAIRKPIISFGAEHSDIHDILRKSNSGKHFLYTDRESVIGYIQECYIQWKMGKFNISQAQIHEFSRKELTQKLSDIL